MSAKVYFAWRCKKSKMYESLAFLKESAMVVVDKWWGKVLSCVDESKMIKKLEEAGREVTEWSIDNEKRHEAQKLIEGICNQPARAPGIDLECGVYVWLKGHYAYFMAMGEIANRGHMDTGELPDYLEEYGYWNNTDKPDDISYRAWDARGKLWYSLDLDNPLVFYFFNPRDYMHWGDLMYPQLKDKE